MLLPKSCPRCRGDLARVEDVGERYYSCVQCGHVLYDLPQAVTMPQPERSPRPTPASRSEVRRRQIRKRLAAERAIRAA